MSEKKGSGRTRSKERDVCRSERGENVGIGERRGEGGEEGARASCRHLGLAFNLRASRRALIRAGSSSSSVISRS